MGLGVVIAIATVALALGAVIGWLFASREGAAAKQTVESLRFQLDEVVKERDANRSAAQELAAFRAAQEERERCQRPADRRDPVCANGGSGVLQKRRFRARANDGAECEQPDTEQHLRALSECERT